MTTTFPNIAKRKPRIMVMGYGGHGKDTASQMLANMYDMKFVSSSMFCAEMVMMPKFESLCQWPEYDPYETAEECYDDRHNYRKLWYDCIKEFNSPDKTKLGRMIFTENDIYCGIRDIEEFEALSRINAFDVSLWVDSIKRLPAEDDSSCTVGPEMADYVIDNNGAIKDLRNNLRTFMAEFLNQED